MSQEENYTKERILTGLRERLTQVRNLLKVSQEELAEKIGFKSYQIRDMEAGKTAPSAEMLALIIETFPVDPGWLFTGKGLWRAGEEDKLHTVKELKAAFKEILEPVVIIRPRGVPVKPTDYEMVPIYTDPVSAGAGYIVKEDIEEYALIHHRVAPHPDHLCCVRVKGDSMQPTLPEGSIVALDITARDPRKAVGRIVCAKVSDDEVALKRLWLEKDHAVLLPEMSDDYRHPPMVVSLEEQPDFLVGTAIWAWVNLSEAKEILP